MASFNINQRWSRTTLSLAWCLASILGTLGQNNNPDSLPDYFGDTPAPPCVLRKNGGQVIGTNGVFQPTVKYYFEKSPVGIWLKDGSTTSFTLFNPTNDSAATDTVYRVDMSFDKARQVEPEPVGGSAPGHSNYYLGDVVAEMVKAENKVAYRSLWDSIHCYFYGSSGGPRMSFVVMPGGDPSNIALKFLGHDSIKVDWQGALKVYVGNKWVDLPQAMAYQVDSTGNTLPMQWIGTYDHEDGASTVGFEFQNFNPSIPLVFQLGYPPLAMGGTTEPRNLNWSTYASSPGGDQLMSTELDEDGDPYVCGYHYFQYYPVALGEIQFPPTIPFPPGVHSGIVMKFDHTNKQIAWASYIGGEQVVATQAKTEAKELAVYKWGREDLQYVFVTGSTSCGDFPNQAYSPGVFANADNTGFAGGFAKSWIAAFTKYDGLNRWATTHGQSGDSHTWSEHGLAIAVNGDGDLVVGGALERVLTDPAFVTETPSGAFTRATGDGWFMAFDQGFGIDWATAFCEYSQGHAGRINDICLSRNNEGHTIAWMVGASASGTTPPLDLVAPPAGGGGYYQTVAGPVSAIVAVVDLDDRSLDYCTRWGSPEGGYPSAAYGIVQGELAMYIVGFTEAFDLTSTQLPPPPAGAGTSPHTVTNNSTTSGQISDAFILRYKAPYGNYVLDYGTLVGGNRSDVFLDVAYDGEDRLYMTGETRSSFGFATDLNPTLYYQPQYNYVDRRDAMIYSLSDAPRPLLYWKTAFGGERSERGWSIAANEYEVYHCGATSSQWTEAFPLRDFDPNTSVDWFWDSNLLGVSSPMVPYTAYNEFMDYELNNIDVFVESYSLDHDGYIASFTMAQEPVGLDEVTAPPVSELWVAHGFEQWLVRTPRTDQWVVTLHDAAGRVLSRQRFTGNSASISMQGLAKGLYVLSAATTTGERYVSKVLVP